MAQITWNIDDQTEVVYKFNRFAKSQILVNGEEVAQVSARKRSCIPFSLSRLRDAQLTIVPSLMGRADMELKVDGQVYLSDREKKQTSCLQCGRQSPPADRFCQKCGAEIPGAETQRKIIKLKEARKIIAVTSGLFLFGGLFFFTLQYDKTSDALGKLASYNDGDIYPRLIGGKQVNVGELRQELQMEPWTLLITNAVLAVIMLGLYFYSRRSPLVGLVAALAVYLSVIVVNALINPLTIAQGLLMKILIIGLLIGGIRSALELRKVEV